jgi:hypothetical protein
METLADFNDTASVSLRSGPARPCYVSQPQAVATIDSHVMPGDVEKRGRTRPATVRDQPPGIVRRAIDP